MSAVDTVRVVKTTKGDITYESDMPMGALKSIVNAGREGDLSDLMEGMAGIVKSWPYEGEPSEVESWDVLRRSQFNEVIEVIMEDLGELGEA